MVKTFHPNCPAKKRMWVGLQGLAQGCHLGWVPEWGGVGGCPFLSLCPEPHHLISSLPGSWAIASQQEQGNAVHSYSNRVQCVIRKRQSCRCWGVLQTTPGIENKNLPSACPHRQLGGAGFTPKLVRQSALEDSALWGPKAGPPALPKHATWAYYFELNIT